jgi:hypothetical protein
MKKITTILSFLFFVLTCMAQNVGIGTTTPHPNAQLDISGINKGLLIPRGDAATRTALNTNTAKGLLMYDTVTNTVWIHNGNGLATGWNSLSNGANYWALQGALGTEIKNTNTGGFWSANTTTVTTDPGIISPPVSGIGTRMFWMPAKSAFRAGTVSGTQWDAGQIGTWSSAMGAHTTASGDYSTALGGFTTASGILSTAMGYGTTAIGDYSTALGYITTASGAFSTAMGARTTASGANSTALGGFTTASGVYSTALGDNNTARSFSSLAIGRNNDSIATSSLNGWVATDPVFYIGNGAASNNRHNAMVVYKNGNMVLKNDAAVITDPGVLPMPVTGSGTRMMWIPQKSAFRAGTVDGTQWDEGQIGTWSSAMGNNTTASGYYSTAMGAFTTASGDVSTAMGLNTTASGLYSTAMGFNTDAMGYASTAMGFNTNASGYYSTAMGLYNTARSYSSLAIGRYSDSIATSNLTDWVATDPLFYIGNGAADNNRHNAMVVYKNGNMVLKNDALVITDPGVLPMPVTGSGTRMMWIPQKSAFRAGTVFGTEWDAGNIGTWSSAMGINTTASGNYSTALGFNTTASGIFSTAMGHSTTASGYVSTAIGFSNTSRSFSSLAIGQYNDSIATSSLTGWVATDPVFYIGNGTADNNRHNAMVVYKNGNMVLKNDALVITDPGVLPVPVTGSGTRMMWIPQKSAFRAGTVDGTDWDAGNIGTWSSAMGVNTTASGNYSTAMGEFTKATGDVSTAMGNATTANGLGSTAMGNATTANGLGSTAMGFGTKASGDNSTAMGVSNTARSYSSLAIGRYNDSIATSSIGGWVATDPVFYIGNGASNAARSNAMVVYKNGNTDHNGYTRLGESANGAPAIKMKRIDVAAGPAINGTANYPFGGGITDSKILGVTVLMTYSGTTKIPPSYIDVAGYEYNFQVQFNGITVINKIGNSANIGAKPITILITYTE